MMDSYLFTTGWLMLLAGYLFISWKRRALASASALLANLVAFFEAFLVEKLLLLALRGKFGGLLFSLFGDRLGGWTEQAALQETSRFVSCAVLGTLIFWLLFLLFALINLILRRRILYKWGDGESKKWRWLSLPAGFAGFVLISFVFLFPVSALSGSVRAAAETCEYPLMGALRIVENPILRADQLLGARPLFNAVTARGGGTTSSCEEWDRAAELAFSGLKIADGQEEEQQIDNARRALMRSELFPSLLGEMVANAAARWQQGEPFLEQTLEIPEGRSGVLLRDALDLLGGWTRQNVVDDLETGWRLYELARDRQFLSMEEAELLHALAEPEVSEALFLELSANADMQALMPALIEFGVGSALDSLGLDMEWTEIERFDFAALSEQERIEEAHAFSTLLRQVERIRQLQAGERPNVTLSELMADLDTLRGSRLLGNVLRNLLTPIFSQLMNALTAK